MKKTVHRSTLLLKIMKVSVVQLLIGFICTGVSLAFDGKAQDFLNKSISLRVEETQLRLVLQAIEQQADVRFVYSSKAIKAHRKITLNTHGQRLSEVLNRVFSPLQITYRIVEGQIILNPVSKTASELIERSESDTNGDVEEIAPVDRTVTGTITDESGVGLPGVNILVKGSQRGTTTDPNGKFKVSVPDAKAILVFSFVGYISQEIVVGNRTLLNVTLKPDLKALEEVVVVGYGTQSRRNITGSVSKVDLKQTENLPNTNITQALRGRVAGVQFNENGRPGQGGTILIRGQRSISANNNPLIIVDGIFFNGNLADINPNDIESMEVLKDASAAAIYGSRAANGVILVTSKKGISAKPIITYNSFVGVSDWSSRMKILSPERYVQKTLDRRRQAGLSIDPNNIAIYFPGDEGENYKNGKSIDPWEEVSQNGSTQSHDLSISGRNENTSYYVSGNFTNEKGIVYNDNAKRISLRSNIDVNITHWLKLGVNSQYTRRNLSGQAASVTEAYWLSPYGRLYNGDVKTDPNPYPVEDQLVTNPMFYALLNKNEEIYANLFANLYTVIEAPFLKGLSFHINYSPNLRWSHTYTSTPLYSRSGLNILGSASKFNQSDFDWVLENIVTYNRQINKDQAFDITLLYGRNHTGYETTRASGNNFFTDVLSWNNLGIAQVQTNTSGGEELNGVSSMFRLNYKLKNRYLFTFTARRDGTSVFGINNKYATFPSSSLAWIASDEPFLKNLKYVDLLKLRLSYGKVGNQAISPYQSLARSSITQYVFGDGSPTYTGVFTSGIANDNLAWETTLSKNIAIDFELFKRKISGTIEYYDLQTKDLLLFRSLPTTTGFSSIITNLGETKNKGLEVTLNTSNLEFGKFKWYTNFVFSTNRNRIVHLYGSDINVDGKEDDDLGNRWFIGHPISVAYDYTFDGVYQANDTNLPNGYKPGFIRVKDLNGDGKFTADGDRSVIGQLQPKYRWGLTNTFQYRNFNLSVFLNAMQGWTQQFNLLDVSNVTLQGNFPERSANMLDAGWWTAENPSTTRPSLVYTNPLGHGYYVSRNFIRIQDVSLSYEFSKSLIKRIKINNLRVFVSGKNLHMFTNYPGFDPESGYNTRGSVFPSTRSLTGGINLSF